MSIGPVSLLNITADVLLLLCALALAVIMLWQDSHRRTRVFAVCMVVFAAYGMSDLLWKFAGPLDYAAYPPLKLATIFYMAGLVLLTLFSLIFGQVSASRWRLTAVFSVPVGTSRVHLHHAGWLNRGCGRRTTGSGRRSTVCFLRHR